MLYYYMFLMILFTQNNKIYHNNYDDNTVKNKIHKIAQKNLEKKKYLNYTNILFSFYKKYPKDPRSENSLYKSCYMSYIIIKNNKKKYSYHIYSTIYNINSYLLNYNNKIKNNKLIKYKNNLLLMLKKNILTK